MDCEKWRKETDLDNLTRNFDYHEKPQVFEYYPQYYHKTDKVWTGPMPNHKQMANRVVGWATSIYRATGQHRLKRHVQDHDLRTNACKPRSRVRESR